jgi:hypothetical protein
MEDKIKSLVENLTLKTNKKEANWERVGRSDKFNLLLDNGIVSMDKIVTNKGNLVFQFSISNLKGDTIHQVNGMKRETYPFDDDYDILKEFHQNIKKAYFKVDETIDGLLGEINKEGEIGKESDDLPF